MRASCLIRFPRRGILSLAMASVLIGGCSVFPESPAARSRDTDTMGQGLRGLPAEGMSAAATDRKQPFWEKFRDKRVRQIDENLGVEEPAGW
jgi:hypothetical protein